MSTPFPANPTVGQTVVVHNTTYRWDGVAWTFVTTPGVTTVTQRTPVLYTLPAPPAGALPCDLWFDSVNGWFFVLFDDGNTVQWVVTNPGRGGSMNAPPSVIPGYPPTGAAGGELTGSYPNPSLLNGPLTLYAKLDGPTFTGTVTLGPAPIATESPSVGDDTKRLATTEWVNDAVLVETAKYLPLTGGTINPGPFEVDGQTTLNGDTKVTTGPISLVSNTTTKLTSVNSMTLTTKALSLISTTTLKMTSPDTTITGPVLHDKGLVTIFEGLIIPEFADSGVVATTRVPSLETTDVTNSIAYTAWIRDLLTQRGFATAEWKFQSGGSMTGKGFIDPGLMNLVVEDTGVDTGPMGEPIGRRQLSISTTDVDSKFRYLQLLIVGDTVVMTDSPDSDPVSAYVRYDIVGDVRPENMDPLTWPPETTAQWVTFPVHLIDQAGSEIPPNGTIIRASGYLNTATGDGPITAVNAGNGLMQVPPSTGASGVVHIAIDTKVVAVKDDLKLFLKTTGGHLTGPLTSESTFITTELIQGKQLKASTGINTTIQIEATGNAANTKIWQAKHVPANYLRISRADDAGTSEVAPFFDFMPDGMLRLSATVSPAEAGNALVTAAWVLARGSAYLPLTGGTLTGQLYITLSPLGTAATNQTIATYFGTKTSEDDGVFTYFRRQTDGGSWASVRVKQQRYVAGGAFGALFWEGYRIGLMWEAYPEALTVDSDGITRFNNLASVAANGDGYFTNLWTNAGNFTSVNVSGPVYGVIEVGGPSGALIDLKGPFGDDYDLRIMSNGANGAIDTWPGLPLSFGVTGPGNTMSFWIAGAKRINLFDAEAYIHSQLTVDITGLGTEYPVQFMSTRAGPVTSLTTNTSAAANASVQSLVNLSGIANAWAALTVSNGSPPYATITLGAAITAGLFLPKTTIQGPLAVQVNAGEPAAVDVYANIAAAVGVNVRNSNLGVDAKASYTFSLPTAANNEYASLYIGRSATIGPYIALDYGNGVTGGLWLPTLTQGTTPPDTDNSPRMATTAFVRNVTSERTYFEANLGAPQTIPNTGQTKIQFTLETYDQAGVYDAPNSRFICPKSGIWHFDMLTALTMPGGSAFYAICQATVNGAIVRSVVTTVFHRATFPACSAVMSVDIPVSAGEVVEFHIWQDSGGNVDLYFDGGYQRLSGYRVANI